MNNAPYQGVANNLAQYGRYGDSMLVHMNPVEVQGLASLSPTGQLTLNPVTGQPEAFLPFLAPLLGSFLGSSLLTGAGAGVLGAAGLSSAAAGAIGSGLATTLATGDLEQGILSGITGFGLGQAFGAAGDALSKAGVDTATQAATDAISTGTQAAPDILSEGFQITPEGFVGQGVPTGTIAPDMGITTTPAAQLMQPSTSALTKLPTVASQAGGMGAAIQPAPPSLTAMQRLGAPLQEPGAFLSELAKPQNILPIYVGEGTGAQLRAEKAMEEGFQKQQEEQDAQRRADLMRTQSQMAGVFNQLRRDYPGIGYAQGGKFEGYFDGGDIENQIYNALRNSPYAGIPSAEATQLSLRGTELVPPPAASYSALDVGGEGYLPGISPEFVYFRTPEAPPAAVDPGSLPGGGDVVGGPFDQNFDLNALLGAFRGYQNLTDLFGGPATAAPPPAPALDEATQQQITELLQQQLNPFTERLGSIEQQFSNIPQTDLTGVYSRFGELENRLGQLPTEPVDLSQFESRFGDLQNQLGQIQSGLPNEIDYSRLSEFVQQPDLSQFENRFGELQSQLGGLQQQIGGINVDQPDLSGIYNRFGELESRLGQIPQTDLSGIESRFGELESRLSNLPAPVVNAPDLSGIYNRFGELESRLSNIPTTDLSGLESRLGGLESQLSNLPAPVVNAPDLSGIYNRFGELESRLSNLPTPAAPDLSGLESRLGSLEQGIGSLRSGMPAPVDLSGLQSQISGLEQRFQNLPAPVVNVPQVDLSPLQERLSGLETRLSSLPAPVVNVPSVDLSPLQERLSGLESQLGNLNIPAAPDLSGLESRLGGLESQLGNFNIPSVDLSPLEQRLAAIENRPMPNFSLDPVMERLAALESRLSAIPTSFSPPPTNTNFDFGFGMQEGGEVPGQLMEQMLPNPMDEATGAYGELIDMTVAAIRGEVENPEAIIQAFVREFGNDAFRQLREAVLQEVVPNAQTEGMVEGMGGGQDDMVPGMIGTQRPVAVSPGEYIIPADVVAMAGGGYSGNGAEFFDGLVDDIRMKTMGTTEQVRPYQERLQ